MGVAKEKESQSFPLRGVRVRKILRQPILEPTLENMNSIASFNKVVKNYIKMKKLLYENK